MTAALVAGLLITAALAIGALRLAIAWLPDNAARLQAWVERQTDLRVEYDTLDARLRWFGPEVVLRGVRILQKDGSQALFRSREGSVGLDLWSLFRTGELVAGRVRFTGPTLTVVRLEDGRIRLLGQNERPLDRPPFDLDRLPAGRVEVTDATVTYRDLATKAAPVTLEQLHFELRRQHDSTALTGAARLPDSLGHTIEFSGDLKGSLEHFDALDAGLELRMDRLVLAGLSPFLPATIARPLAGAGEVEAMIHFAGGQLTHARLDLALQDVSLALPSRAAPPVSTLTLSAPERPAGASPMTLPHVTSTIVDRPADTGSTQVQYPNLRGSVRLRHDGETWTIRAQKLLLYPSGRPGVVPTTFSVRWRGDLATTFDAALSATDLRLHDVWPLALAFAPHALDRWAGLNPTGEIRTLRIEASRDRAGASPRFAMSADVEGVGFSASGTAPGIAGFTGVMSGTDQGGRLSLRSQAFTFDLPRMFREPIVGVAVSADVDWKRDGDAWVIGSGNVAVVHPGARAHGRFEYRYERPGISPFLDMEIQVEHAEVALAGRVLPYGSFGSGAVSWLAPAFLAGQVDAGQVSYRGRVHDFPFKNGEGDFTATASLSGVGVDYFAGFAPLEKGQGIVEFHNAGFVARMHGGEVGGLRLDHAEVGIADMHEAVVEVDATASGDLARALPFVQRSPVGAVLGGQFMGLTGQGPADYSVKLHLPTLPGEPHDLVIRTNLRSATVGIPALRAPAERVTGTFEVHNLEMRAHTLRGSMLDGPFELDVEPGPLTRDVDASVLMHGRGHSVGAGLPAFIGLPPGIRMSGAADWKFEGRMERHRGTEQWTSRYDIASDLFGLGVSAPEPFPKAPADARPTHVGLTFAPSGLSEIAVESGPARVRLQLTQEADGRVRLDRGIARFDGRPLVMPDRPGLRFAGDWPSFDLGEWLALDTGGKGGESMSQWLGPTEVHVDKARIFGFEFEQLDAALKPQPAALQVQVSGPLAEGDVTIPDDLQGGSPIRFAMDRLHLRPAAESGSQEGATVDPRKVPALDMDIADFAWGERRFGHLVANVTKEAMGLSLSGATATTADTTITAQGEWLAEGSGSRTRLGLELRSSNLGATSKALGIPGALEAERATARASVSWPDGPTGSVLAHLNGTLGISLDRGQLRNVKPGAGRMLGLTSLAELPRRLALDFHDVTDAGLAFDSVRGDFEIRDGNAYTQNLLLKGPAVDIGIAGRTGLATEDYDQMVVVSGNPAGPATVAGALAGGPIGAAGGFLISQLFKGQLQGLARVYYHVTGPWADPVVERVSSQVGEAPTTAPPPEQDVKQ
ncbi:MAG: YhdP family protein [Steroidobacteraceae bacterium]